MEKARRRRNCLQNLSQSHININEILNEIEIHEGRKLAAGDIFYNICHSRTQIINEIVNEIEIQEWRRPAAGQVFHSICHSRTQINNEILNEIEK